MPRLAALMTSSTVSLTRLAGSRPLRLGHGPVRWGRALRRPIPYDPRRTPGPPPAGRQRPTPRPPPVHGIADIPVVVGEGVSAGGRLPARRNGQGPGGCRLAAWRGWRAGVHDVLRWLEGSVVLARTTLGSCGSRARTSGQGRSRRTLRRWMRMRRMAVTFRMADCRCASGGCSPSPHRGLLPCRYWPPFLDVGSGSLGQAAQRRAMSSRHTARSAVVGDSRAARRAGSRPAIAPIVIAAPIPPAHAVVGMTTAQCLVLA
jgi:hypothetical protein